MILQVDVNFVARKNVDDNSMNLHVKLFDFYAQPERYASGI